MKTKQTAMSIAFLLLVGCKAVSYQSAGFQGGYSDNALNESSYQVNYYGNGSVSLEKAIDFAMLRSAVIAKTKGAEYFKTTKHHTEVDRVNLGTQGVYADKPSVTLHISLLKSTHAEQQVSAQKNCALFSSMLQLNQSIFKFKYIDNKDQVYTHSTNNCLSAIKAKYQLTDAQVYAN
jgi:hypothetical protein